MGGAGSSFVLPEFTLHILPLILAARQRLLENYSLMAYLQLIGWVGLILVTGLVIVGGFVFCCRKRPSWFKTPSAWLFYTVLFFQYTLTAFLQALDMIFFEKEANASVTLLEVSARYINVLAIVDLILLILFVDYLHEMINNVRAEMRLAPAAMFFSKLMIMIAIVHLFYFFFRDFYELFVMGMYGVLLLFVIVRYFLYGAPLRCRWPPIPFSGNANIVKEEFKKFLTTSITIIVISNWLAYINFLGSIVPGGQLAQVAAVPLTMLAVLYHFNKKIKDLIFASDNDTVHDVAFRGIVAANGEAGTDGQVHFHNLNDAYSYQNSELASAAVDQFNNLILDLDGSDAEDDENQAEMDIWQFMKTESAREDRKEAKLQECVSWGQFLKESARERPPEVAIRYGECSSTVRAEIHNVDESMELEEAEVQQGGSQTKLPDIAKKQMEEEVSDAGEKMSLESYHGEGRVETPLSWKEYAVSDEGTDSRVEDEISEVGGDVEQAAGGPSGMPEEATVRTSYEEELDSK